MNIIRKILYAFVALFALMSIFIIVCASRPDITQKIQTMLYHGYELTAEPDRDLSMDIDQELDWLATDVVYLPSDGDESTDSTQDAESDVRRPSKVNYDSTDSNDSEPNVNTESDGLRSDNKAGYIAPDEAKIVAPDNVSGKSGYKQIEGDAQQIDDDAADNIQNQLSLGNTGDGLTFDATFYPYYNMLDDKGKHVYRQIYANANAVYPAFRPVEEVTSAQLRNIFTAVYNDHPELFWLETAYACKYVSTGKCVEIDLKFNKTSQNLNSAKAEFNGQVNDIIAGVQSLWDDYDKEKYVHDQLIDRISYNARADMNQSAYSALVKGQTVCAGYARAFQYIMQQLDIPCYYCTGFAGEKHAWNIVELSDGFYNVDTTWDDLDGRNYDYFNKSDEDFSSNHLRKELSVYLPPCNGKMFRNLEQNKETDKNGSTDGLRSLADVGLTEDQVFSNVDAYYKDCYKQVIQNGVGRYTFYNAVANLQMAADLTQNYNNRICWNTYLKDATNALEATYCEWNVTAEELQGGKYLLIHEIRMVK